jgi:outer membrane protein OmpA-like peptidoglycan-associated protein
MSSESGLNAAPSAHTDRISIKGLGEAAPVVPSTSAANRPKNRRVVTTALDR